MPGIDLQRFIDAQRDSFERALSEIEAGRKSSHWMWFIFPQVSGLGFSPTSIRYAIRSVDEASAFLEHSILGERYHRIVDAVWHQVVEVGTTVQVLFGSPDDAKLVSSLTLFVGVARDPEHSTFLSRSGEILDAAFAQGLGRCERTERFLGD